jgi:hypothetical protein
VDWREPFFDIGNSLKLALITALVAVLFLWAIDYFGTTVELTVVFLSRAVAQIVGTGSARDAAIFLICIPFVTAYVLVLKLVFRLLRVRAV